MPLIYSIEEVADKQFDFVIVGSSTQTAALVVANCLSEMPDFSVLVLEAGNAHVNDPIILSPPGWIQQLGKPEYDWGFQTIPQVHSGNRSIPYFRGKGLGGSSAMNCLVWVKPHSQDIDVFKKLGNPGWNWDNYHKYSKKSETLHEPVPSLREFQLTYASKDIGNKGPLSVSFSPMSSGAEYPLMQSLEKLGISVIDSAYSGQTCGSFKLLSSVDPKTHVRMNSATAYLFPVIDRSNLHVLTSALVTQVTGSNDTRTGFTAEGVKFEYDGHTFRVFCKKEVILSAGTIKSPQILKLSGIGDRAILKRLGIKTKVDLPAVGTNVSDHNALSGPAYELKEGHDFITFDLISDPDLRSKLKDPYEEITDPLPLVITGFLFFFIHKTSANVPSLIEKVSAKINDPSAPYSQGLREQYCAQLELLKNDSVPDLELIVLPWAPAEPKGKAYVKISPIVSHPFSRGTIHIQSTDPHVQPAIDPQILAEDIDLDLFIAGLKVAHAAAQLSPFKDIIAREYQPGPGVTTDEEIQEYARASATTVWHNIRSCSMLPKDKGGVVDPRLKVYGTTNIRIVDLSIIPI